jgi:SAM-dependent methyltransferase
MVALPETTPRGPTTFQGGVLVARSCPVCGSSRETRVFAEASVIPESLTRFAFSSRKAPENLHHRIVECEECELLYSSPVPTREFLESAYRDASFGASEESRLASLTYGDFLRRFVRPPDRRGALDIGTGDGAFLQRLLEQGFTDVVGVEPSAAPVAVASPRVKGLIRLGPFRASEFEAGRFQLVTCFQTMEHVDDPLGLCRDAHRLLRGGGAIFLVCHNHRALSARVMGLKSPIFDIEHLQLFSPRSIRKTLERAGFTGVEVRVVVNRYPLHYWAKLAPLPASMKAAVLRWLEGSRLGRTLLAAPVGNLAAVGYKPA